MQVPGEADSGGGGTSTCKPCFRATLLQDLWPPVPPPPAGRHPVLRTHSIWVKCVLRALILKIQGSQNFEMLSCLQQWPCGGRCSLQACRWPNTPTEGSSEMTTRSRLHRGFSRAHREATSPWHHLCAPHGICDSALCPLALGHRCPARHHVDTETLGQSWGNCRHWGTSSTEGRPPASCCRACVLTRLPWNVVARPGCPSSHMAPPSHPGDTGRGCGCWPCPAPSSPLPETASPAQPGPLSSVLPRSRLAPN